jgi:hypothetical protein
VIQVGDRIEVVALMTDDPLPPPVGAKGTVTEVTDAVINIEDGHYKAYVRWDEGIVAVGVLLIPQDDHVYQVVSE